MNTHFCETPNIRDYELLLQSNFSIFSAFNINHQNYMSTKNSLKNRRLKSINLHEGRLRKLIQFLKEKEAVIKVDHDPYGLRRIRRNG